MCSDGARNFHLEGL